jgi:hypothetical protein
MNTKINNIITPIILIFFRSDRWEIASLPNCFVKTTIQDRGTRGWAVARNFQIYRDQLIAALLKTFQ